MLPNSNVTFVILNTTRQRGEIIIITYIDIMLHNLRKALNADVPCPEGAQDCGAVTWQKADWLPSRGHGFLTRHQGSHLISKSHFPPIKWGSTQEPLTRMVGGGVTSPGTRSFGDRPDCEGVKLFRRHGLGPSRSTLTLWLERPQRLGTQT